MHFNKYCLAKKYELSIEGTDTLADKVSSVYMYMHLRCVLRECLIANSGNSEQTRPDTLQYSLHESRINSRAWIWTYNPRIS